MPWKSNTLREARSEFVQLALAPNANIQSLCRRFNISRQTGYQTLERYRLAGAEGLESRSRRPHHTPHRCPDTTETAVLTVRANHPTWGGRKIASHLRSTGSVAVPAPSTITAILARHNQLDGSPAQGKFLRLLGQLHTPISQEDLPTSLVCHPDLKILIEKLEKGRPIERRRALAVVASRSGLRTSLACRILKQCRSSYVRSVRLFEDGGAEQLFALRINPHRKFDSEQVKQALFNILHQPPANFGINRTTWKMADLARVMSETGQPACEDVIRTIVKRAGYRWRKARIVLTSNDPEFSQKLQRIRSILCNLTAEEAFFSIDEFGPFAVKAQPGRMLIGPGEQRFVSQWQRSKGSIIVTAAIELSSNQVTHFYSVEKNTDEMIRMMEALVAEYSDRKKLYLSWDAASWHVSKKLFERIDTHNASIGGNGPQIDTAALPARAQFLNVIESVFSGMARAIIHNSNYETVDEAKRAMDRYFCERNIHFRRNPGRAGGKLWGKERVPAEFSPSNNCKDPRLG
ncbi:MULTISPECIES: IS630 family transposase [Bradyrhizobium]|jgi:transposase|uniref:IS630 family transposase n=1 Tax=Bradyrhizobium TaxID=374 RepID=UPI0003A970A7|nr:IS630 family transposase [Bradyrhizobium denitrificans]MCL8486238.1 IS630 family transposase [Bradyrhizobium denitrificans]